MKQFLLIKIQNVKFALNVLFCGSFLLRGIKALIVKALRSFSNIDSIFLIGNQSLALSKWITNQQINQYEYIHLNILHRRQAENPFPKSRRNFNKKEF